MSNEIELFGEVLTCPRGNGHGTLQINLKELLLAESRLIEVQSATKHKAMELQGFFNISANECHKLMAALTKELDDAIKNREKIKAVITLDKMSDILKEKGLFKASNPAGSADLRDSVIVLDPEYDKTVDIINQLKSLIEMIKGKREAFVRAYFSVKDIIHSEVFLGNNTNLSINEKDF